MLPLILNLERYTRLSADDRSALRELGDTPLLTVRSRREIIKEGDNPDVVRLMVSGWACRFKDLPDGRRQIVGFFIPGDFCDLNIYVLRQMDHSVGAITDVSYHAIPPEHLHALMGSRPRVAQALLSHELVNGAIQREWLLNLGQRTSFERLAHLLVELFTRLKAIGLTRGNMCEMPLTQNDLADAAGITPVHVNRTLQDMRRDGLVELRARRLTILDMDRLKDVSMFNDNYLFLEREGNEPNSDD